MVEDGARGGNLTLFGVKADVDSGLGEKAEGAELKFEIITYGRSKLQT